MHLEERLLPSNILTKYLAQDKKLVEKNYGKQMCELSNAPQSNPHK